MKIKLRLVPFLLVCFLLSACSFNPAKDAEPGITGYVVKKEDRRFLVVSSEPQTIGGTGGEQQYYKAVWFSKVPKQIQIGQTVQVWFGMMDDSYPGQSQAKKVSVLPSTKPDGANLSEAEAIRNALAQQGDLAVPIIKAAHYNAASDEWTIVLKQRDHEWSVEVEDPSS